MYAVLLCVLGALPQADREALVLERAQLRQEARMRATYPAYYAARQAPQPVPQVQVNVYAPSYNVIYGAPVLPYNYYGYGWGRPAWPPAW